MERLAKLSVIMPNFGYNLLTIRKKAENETKLGSV